MKTSSISSIQHECVMNIAELSTKEAFLQDLGELLPAEDLTGVWFTLSLLKRLSNHPERLSFVSSALTVTTGGMLDPSRQKLLQDLAISSHETSSRAACSSLLAGRSSESDGFADVGILLPMIGGDEQNGVLEELGLGDWIREGARVAIFNRRDVPDSLCAIRQAEGVNLDKFESLISQLQDKFEMRIEGNDNIVMWLFLGTLVTEGKSDLAGLVGAGVWSD